MCALLCIHIGCVLIIRRKTVDISVLVFKNKEGDIVLIRGRVSFRDIPTNKLSGLEQYIAASAAKKGQTVEIEMHHIPDPAQ